MTDHILASGKTYRCVPAPTPHSCDGCVARYDGPLCDKVSQWCLKGDVVLQLVAPSHTCTVVLPADPILQPNNHEYAKGYAAGASCIAAEWDKWQAGRAAPSNAMCSLDAAMSRTFDPATSQRAARDVGRKSGRIADLILTELKHANKTGKQLAASTGVPLNSITPRFAQLYRKGLIHAASGDGRETKWALGNGVKAEPTYTPMPEHHALTL